MNKKLLTLIAIILCATGLYFWWFSDSKVVTRNTESLIECFEKDAGDGRFGGAITTSTFRDLLDDKVGLKVNRDDIPYASDFGSIFDKGSLVQMHGGLANSPAIVTITDKVINIIDITADTANVQLDFHIKTNNLPRDLDHSIKTQLTFKKTDGDWKVSQATITE
ncbi:MAG: hypothetical protein ACSHX6_07340 [Akkermansiaceae bacterium]